MNAFVKKTFHTFNPLRMVRLLDRKKVNPYHFHFTGEAQEAPASIQLFKYNKNELVELSNLTSADEIPATEPGFTYWLNIHGLHNVALVTTICEQFNIHHLVIQDILDVNQRSKFQDFEEYLFFSIKSMVPSDQDLVTEHMSFILKENVLLSFQEKKGDHFEHIRNRIRQNLGVIRERTPDYLLYTLFEAILDNYFKTTQVLERESEHLNNLILQTDTTPALIQQIELTKRKNHLLRRVIIPIKEVLMASWHVTSPVLHKRHKKYFYELKELCLSLLDFIESIENSLSSSSNLFFSMQSHTLNQITKTLTIVATIFIPLTFIAGIYGMNFTNMPELEWQWGYAGVWSIFIAVTLGMIVWFRSRKWV